MVTKRTRTQKRAIYPGTFDPVTNGHLSLIERASRIFDELVVAVSINAGKSPFFEFEERLKLMTAAVKKQPRADHIKVVGFESLTAELAREINATAIVRGLRAVSDFEYEFQMALMNRKLAREVETVFLMPSLSWVYLSSTIVKDVASNGGEINGLVPAGVKRAFARKLGLKK
ncbi:MAG: pantetheine-phosphate adenylyltransferase [candidate division Zixibacteria bacterium]|nr:pantetheine-phosphate adenylyltransferase [candidate division Zixibacteria bacterium]